MINILCPCNKPAQGINEFGKTNKNHQGAARKANILSKNRQKEPANENAENSLRRHASMHPDEGAILYLKGWLLRKMSLP